jgi:hypothetical protein
MFRLPVSGWEVVVRPPNGTDDLVILEMEGNAIARSLTLLARVARRPDAEGADWPTLCVTDFEMLLAMLRQTVLGPAVTCAFDCPGPDCRERVEVGFNLTDYVGAVRPRRTHDVIVSTRPHWFCLTDAVGSFRLPTAADQSAMLGRSDAAQRLAERCLDPADMSGSARVRAERAMAAMAPEISRPVVGRCPACGATVRAGLHLPSLVMAELQRAAEGLHEDVHVLASAYHWHEEVILALPRKRRQDYAMRARRLLVGAA